MAKAKSVEDDGSLKRLGGGRWQTRDDRFTIEPQSGTWVVVDGEQADDLGLPLVRGPFASLTAAKAAIATARSTEPAVSPLAARVAEVRARPATAAPAAPVRSNSKGAPARPRTKAATPRPAPEPEPPPEPAWLRGLEPPERRRAHDLIDRLAKAGAPDPEGIARRDVAGDVPAVAVYVISRMLDGLGVDASAEHVAAALVEGRDPDLDVRWRLVDGEGRPITLPLKARASVRHR